MSRPYLNQFEARLMEQIQLTGWQWVYDCVGCEMAGWIALRLGIDQSVPRSYQAVGELVGLSWPAGYAYGPMRVAYRKLEPYVPAAAKKRP